MCHVWTDRTTAFSRRRPGTAPPALLAGGHPSLAAMAASPACRGSPAQRFAARRSAQCAAWTRVSRSPQSRFSSHHRAPMACVPPDGHRVHDTQMCFDFPICSPPLRCIRMPQRLHAGPLLALGGDGNIFSQGRLNVSSSLDTTNCSSYAGLYCLRVNSHDGCCLSDSRNRRLGP